MSRRKRHASGKRDTPAIAAPANALGNDVVESTAESEALEAAEREGSNFEGSDFLEAGSVASESVAAPPADATPDAAELHRAGQSAPNPYAVLADYERRSFAHVVASADQVQAPGLWRGIAFRVGSRRLMSSITEVSEILPVLHHTSVPGTQPWLLGVVNVRGNLVPLVDLRGYIEGERTPLGDTSRMLVARHGSNAIGLLVEEVLGQRNLTAENDPLKLENDAINWARFVPAHFELDGKLWGVFSMAALVAAPDFLHAAA